MNSFGVNFKITIFGESHGKVIGVVIDGVRAGMPLSEEDFHKDLSRRKSGGAATTKRTEDDIPHIVSGVFNGYTTGAPIAILFYNNDIRPSDYDKFNNHPRPSHADLTARIKFNGFNDPRGGGAFSGRMTLCLVAAGVIAKKMLEGVSCQTDIVSIGGVKERDKFADVLKRASDSGDSVGGVIESCFSGIKAGLGNPFFDSAESTISHLLFSIPGVKGVEFGSGFEGAENMGSVNNDLIISGDGKTATNNDGGINGGITNGNPIVVRVAIKPTPSISVAQNTYNFETNKIEPLTIEGRHDACIAIRGAVVVESVIAIALADLTLRS